MCSTLQSPKSLGVFYAGAGNFQAVLVTWRADFFCVFWLFFQRENSAHFFSKHDKQLHLLEKKRSADITAVHFSMSPTLVNQSKCYAIILLLSLRAFKKGNIQLQQFSNQTFYIMAQTKDNLSSDF